MANTKAEPIKTPIPNDVDPAETAEWLESLDYVLESKGPERVGQLISALETTANRHGVELPFTATTPYINTIPREKQPPYPGNRELERRIKSFVRWNAMAMVTRANRDPASPGGHISTFASSATLYEVALNHFIRGRGRKRLRWRSSLLPGPRGPWHVRPRVSGRPTHRAEPGELPPRIEPRGRVVVVSASMVDAQLLGIPHRVDGPWPDHGDLSSTVQRIPHRSRNRRLLEEASLVLHGRRRMRRAGKPGRDHARLTRAARQS